MDWNRTIEQFNHLIPVDLVLYDAIRFSFQSTLNTRIHGSRYHPKTPNPNLAVVLLYHGLGAVMETQGYQEIKESWIEQGYIVMGIDVRNQGGLTRGNPKPDPRGLYFSGIDTLDENYFVQLYLDSYRLVDVAKQLYPGLPIFATGGSQGGALAIVAGIYHPSVTLVMADMPNCIDIPYLIHHSKGGFKAFQSLPKLTEMQCVLDNVDLMNMATNLTKPTLLASGTDDEVCPNVTTVQFFDRLRCEKDLVLYPGFGHGGYDTLHFPKKLAWIASHQR